MINKTKLMSTTNMTNMIKMNKKPKLDKIIIFSSRWPQNI